MKWVLSGSQVVGGVHPLHGSFPFARAPVVLRRSDCADRLIQVKRYHRPDEASGDIMTLEEWDAFVASGLAFALPDPLEAALGGALWVFPAGYGPTRKDALNELRSKKLLLAEPLRFDPDTIVCHVQEPAASVLRDWWRMAAFDRAWAALRAKDLKRAFEEADLAFVLDLQGNVDPPALLACVHDLRGERAEAERLAESMRRSKGDAYYRIMREKWADFARELRTFWRGESAGLLRPRASDELSAQRVSYLRGAMGAL